MKAKLIHGDIFDIKTDYLVQQTNIISGSNVGGIAETIKKKFNIWGGVSGDYFLPGSVEIVKTKDPLIKNIVNLYGQKKPGRESVGDTVEMREEWFRQGLCELEILLAKDAKITFPYKIGCGLAGGDWEDVYLPMLNEFSQVMDHVYIVKNF